MSSGPVHDKLTKTIEIPLSIGVSALTYYFSRDLVFSGIVFFLVLAGFETQRYNTPDIDIADNPQYKYGYYGFWLVRQNFGRVAYYLAKAYWWPFGKLTPHRAFWSHGLFIGTLVRIAYLFIPIWVISWIIISRYASNIEIWHFLASLLPYGSFYALGWFLGDLGHLFLDYNFSFRGWYEKLLGPAYIYHVGHKE